MESLSTQGFCGTEGEVNMAPILAYPDFSILFILCTNASGNSIGFNLTQVENGWGRAIVYGDRNFSDTKKKYSITECEAFPVIVAIQRCIPYLLVNHFTVFVDHQILKWLCTCMIQPEEWPGGLWPPKGITLLFKTVQEETRVMQMHCYIVSIPLLINLCSHKLQQMKCTVLRTWVSSFNPLSKI